MLEVMEFLRASGFKTYIVTGDGTGNGITDANINVNEQCSPSCQQNIIIANGTIKGFSAGIYTAPKPPRSRT